MVKKLTRVKDGAQRIIRDFEGGKPRTTGRVYQVIGGLLIADGLIGIENPFGRRRSRPGILGALILGIVGFVFLAVGLLLISPPKTDSVTSGLVSFVSEPTRSSSAGAGSDRDSESGAPTCSFSAEYTVGGRAYTADSTINSSGNCSKRIGSSLDVHYLESQPHRGVVDLGTQKMFRLGAIGLGGLLMLIGGFTFVLRAASMFFGIQLLLRGRKLLKANPTPDPDEESTIETAKQAFMQMRFESAQEPPRMPSYMDAQGAGAHPAPTNAQNPMAPTAMAPTAMESLPMGANPVDPPQMTPADPGAPGAAPDGSTGGPVA